MRRAAPNRATPLPAVTARSRLLVTESSLSLEALEETVTGRDERRRRRLREAAFRENARLASALRDLVGAGEPPGERPVRRSRRRARTRESEVDATRVDRRHAVRSRAGPHGHILDAGRPVAYAFVPPRQLGCRRDPRERWAIRLWLARLLAAFKKRSLLPWLSKPDLL